MQKLSILLLSLTSLLSANSVNITLPKVPIATTDIPKVIVVDPNSKDYKSNEEILKEYEQKHVVTFSDHVAPQMLTEKDNQEKIALVGDIKDGFVPAYLHLPLMSSSEITKKLKEAGFTILSTYKIDKKGLVESIVFTDATIQKHASQKDRGFASALRVTIDTKEKLVSITNPLYTMAAFMQQDYEPQIADDTLSKLRNTFKDIKNSTEMAKFRILEHYQFMAGMPKYQDMQVIKKADTQKLLAKAQESKKIVFEQHLENGAILIGVKLSKRTSKFIKKVGYQNAGLLPYPVLIEDGEAKILDPKYYIAIMYPMLKMSQFMKIATVPGAIGKDIDRIFR